jgi:hypothetical protein
MANVEYVLASDMVLMIMPTAAAITTNTKRCDFFIKLNVLMYSM